MATPQWMLPNLSRRAATLQSSGIISMGLRIGGRRGSGAAESAEPGWAASLDLSNGVGNPSRVGFPRTLVATHASSGKCIEGPTTVHTLHPRKQRHAAPPKAGCSGMRLATALAAALPPRGTFLLIKLPGFGTVLYGRCRCS